MRIFGIGDVHGHFDELQALLTQLSEKADYDPDVDHLVLLGDLVDVGPKTKEVLDWAILYKAEHPTTFHPLKGNHDDMMVDALLHDSRKYQPGWWLKDSGYARETLFSYPQDNEHVVVHESGFSREAQIQIPRGHLLFLDSLPYYWETPEYFFVHAGVPPLPLRNLNLSDPEIEYEMIWIRQQFYGSDIDFGKKIIFAHTGFEDHTNMDPETVRYAPLIKENMIGINTMPRNEGKLTCIQLPDEIFYYQEKL